MRPGQVAVIALLAAALGGLIAVAGDALLGEGDGGDTVVLTTPRDAEDGADDSASPASAKPLLGNGFNPAAIYRRRSPGVVTIYSIFEERPSDDEDHAAQGSGFVVSP